MKQYIQPKIKAVELDFDQAILQACTISGGYFEGATNCGGARGLPSGVCTLTPKGSNTNRAFGTSGQSNQNPSS